MNKQEEDICEICLSGTSDTWECRACGRTIKESRAEEAVIGKQWVVSDRLSQLVEQLPPDLQADWQNTNHYELQTPRGKEFFWLCVPNIDFEKSVCDTEAGERLGLLLDIAEELSRIFYQQSEKWSKHNDRI